MAAMIIAISSRNPVVVHIVGGKFVNIMFFVVDDVMVACSVAADLTVVSQ